MNLFIKVEDGNPVDHPVADWNLVTAFGEIPSNYEVFFRGQKPELGRFEVDDPDAIMYAKGEDGVWTDLWPTRPMNPEERATKEAEIIASLEMSRTHLLEEVYPRLIKMAVTDEQRADCEAFKLATESAQLSAEEDFYFPTPLPNVFGAKRGQAG
jgi:hypothetical protein